MTGTAGGAATRGAAASGWYRSASGRLRPLATPALVLVGLVGLAYLVHGFRVLGTPWLGGDLLYHQALAHEVLRGELPTTGPYAGLPTYYPPGFHVLLAATMAVTGLDAARSVQLLTLLWLPVLPVATYVLARAVTGRAWIAVLATALTLFAGALDLRAGRLWVNSLFLGGHAAYPLYPRDIVFALVPFGILALLRALRPGPGDRRVAAWAALGGAVFGVAGLTQVQLLLPLPFAVALTALAVAVRDPRRRRAAAIVVLVSGTVAAVVVAPWLVGQLEAIGRNAGVALDSSETLEPARFGFWAYPRQFGLLLPFGIVGAGVALAWLRGTGSASPAPVLVSWRPRPPEAGLLLVAWWAIPFALGILYRPDWPLEDALRPQRLWLLASQPLAILGAVGLAVAVRVAVGGWLRRPRWVLPLVVAAVLVVSAPATFTTAQLLDATWTRPTYAHLDLEADRVPDFAALLGDRGGPPMVVLTHEDWSSLAWYQTGHDVVAVVPAGFAKLAYDPGIFTGRSQVQRRADLARAFSGDVAALLEVADAYGARIAVVARRGDRWGLLDVPAALAVADGGTLFPGNGWDGVALDPGGSIAFEAGPDADLELEIRVTATGSGEPSLVVLREAGPGPGRELARVDVAPAAGAFQVVTARLEASSGRRIELVALDPLIVQSIRGFVAPPPVPAGWELVATDRAWVLRRR